MTRVIDVAVPLGGLYLDPYFLYESGLIPGGFYGAGWRDPIVDIFDSSYIRIRGVKVSNAFGLNNHWQPPSDLQLRLQTKPIERKDYVPSLDASRYASLLESWKTPYLDGSRPPKGGCDVLQITLLDRPVVASRELHYPPVGTSIRGAPVSASPHHYTSGGGQYTRVHSFENGPDLGFDETLSQVYVTGAQASIGVRLSEVEDILKNLNLVTETTTGSNGEVVWGLDHAYLKSLNAYRVYEADDSTIVEVEYEFWIRYPNFRAIQVRRKLRVQVRNVAVVNGFDMYCSSTQFSFTCTYSDTCDVYDIIPFTNIYAQASWWGGPRSNTHTRVITGSRVFALTRAYDSEQEARDVTKLLRRLTNDFRRLGSDLRPGAAISSSDALTTLQSSSNFVEAAAEFGGLLESIESLLYTLTSREKVAEVFRYWVEKARGDPRKLSSAIRETWADQVLLERFGIAPTQQDVANIFRLSQEYDILTERIAASVNIQGSHAFDAQELDNLLELRVRIRSTLRLSNTSITEFGQGLLSADSRGTFPKLSRVWNSLKYTFLIDYAFGIGNRMNVVESYITLVLIGLVSGVHVYDVKFRYKDERYVREDGAPIRVKGFARELTKFAAFPGSRTRLNFMPPRLPGIEIILALALSLLDRVIALLRY